MAGLGDYQGQTTGEKIRNAQKDRATGISEGAKTGFQRLIEGANMPDWGRDTPTGRDVFQGNLDVLDMLRQSKIPREYWNKFVKDAKRFGIETPEQMQQFIADIERGSGL